MAQDGSRKRRLAELSGLGGVSDTALSRILDFVRKNPEIIDAGTTKTVVHKAALRVLDDVGPEVHDLSLCAGQAFPAGLFRWYTVPLSSLCAYFCKRSPQFRSLLQGLWERGNRTWSLVLYTDEFTPGALLRPDNRRKVHVWYVSFLELGYMLAYAEAWLPIALLRSTAARQLTGGLSAASRLLLRSMFVGPLSISTSGITLPVGSGCAPTLVFIRMAAVIADADALHSLWAAKSCSGTVPCGVMCCVVAKANKLDTERGIAPLTQRGPGIVDISCSDITKMSLCTDEDVWAKCDALKASKAMAGVGKGDFGLIEQCLGMNYAPNGILADVELREYVRPTQVNRYDVMHIFFSGGIFPFEVELFLARSNVPFRVVHEFLIDGWTWKKSHQNTSPADVFCEARASSGSLKASAGELVALYPAFRFFAQARFEGEKALEKELDSLLKLCAVLDIVEACRRRATKDEFLRLADALQRAMAEYLEAFTLAYGSALVRNKHHMAMHIADQIRRDVLLLSCWVLERKHQLAKQAIEYTDRTSAFEKGGLARMLNEQERQLERPHLFQDHLVAPTLLFPEFAAKLGCVAAFASKKLVFETVPIVAGEFLFVGEQQRAFVVAACGSAGSRFFLFVHRCEMVGRLTSTSTTWRRQSAIDCLELESSMSIRHANAWKREGELLLHVIH